MFRKELRRISGRCDVTISSELASEIHQDARSAIDSGLARLETANNWMLTVALGIVIAIVSSGTFPSAKSLMLLCAAVPLVSHFTVRAMKGYINVIRFSVIRRAAAGCVMSSEQNICTSSEDLREKIRIYEFEWRLPLARYHVWEKALTEFGIGYISVALAGLITYDASNVHLTFPVGLVCISLTVAAILELINFQWRSPYMREGPRDGSAIRNR